MKRIFTIITLRKSSRGRVALFDRTAARLCMMVMIFLATGNVAKADVTLFSADFTTMTPEETTNTKTDYDKTINGVSVKIRSKYTITNSLGLQFTEGNITKDRGFIAIPLTNINGTFTVTIQHQALSNSTNSVRYMYSDGTTMSDYDIERAKISTTSGSETAVRVQSAKNGNSLTFTVQCNDSKGLLFVGRYNASTNIETISITTPDGGATPTLVTPTLSATNITIEKGGTGSSSITATGVNGSNLSDLTYTYQSDNASVATVASNGTVTGVTAGTATITVTSAAVAGVYESATTTFTVTVTDSSAPVGESTKWDFSTMTSAEVAAMKANKDYFTTRNQDDYLTSSNSTFWPKNTDIPIQDANGVDIHVFEGLKVYRSNNNIGTSLRIYYNSGEKRLYLGGSNFTIKMPAQTGGNIVRVTWSTTNTNTSTISSTNMTATENLSSSSNSTKVVTDFRVDSDGVVDFSFSSNAQIFKIEVIELQPLTAFEPNGSQDRTVPIGTTISDLSILADPMSAMSAGLLSIESSDPTVVDVSSATPSGIGSNGYFLYGGIRAIGGGTATLTIKYAGNDTYKAASCTVNVTVTDERAELNRFSPMGGANQREKTNIVFSSFASGATTKQINQYCILAYANADNNPASNFTTADFEVVSSSNEEVVPLSSISISDFNASNGRLLLDYTVNKVAGESTITVRFKGTATYKTTTTTFTVIVTDDRTKITLSADNYTLVGGTSYEPVITAIDGNGNEVAGLSYTLKSSASRVTVSGTTLTATNSTGGTTITVTYAGSNQYQPATATFKVTVVSKMTVELESSTITMLRETTASVLDYLNLVDANGNALTIDGLPSLLTLDWKDASADHKGISFSGLSVTSGETTGKVTMTLTFAGNANYDSKTEDIVVEVIKISAPAISASGQITQAQGATVYYTTDGSDPRTSNTRQTGTLPIQLTLTDTQTIYAVATDNTDVSRVAELNYVNPTQTYQYTLEDNNKPGLGKVETMTDGSNNVVMRMTYGDLPEYVQKSGNSIWKTKARDGRMRDAEFDNYQISTIAENYDGTSEDSYNGSNGYGSQFVGYDVNTPFSLPIAGAYVKFEPEVDGLLQVVIRQNGSFVETGDVAADGSYNLRRRVVFFADETGRAYVPGEEYTAQMNLNSTIDPKLFDFNHSNVKEVDHDNFDYYQGLLFGQTLTDEQWAANRNGEAIANQLVTSLVQHSSQRGVLLGDVPGYLCVTKAYVKYTINVKAGKTYFLTGNTTKVGLCGYQFTPDASYQASEATLEEGTKGGDATSANSTLLSGTVGEKYNVALTRTFEADQWATLVLPFSVSASKVKEVFGENTLILNFNDVTTTVNENGATVLSLNLRKHYHQMIVAGMPLLIKPSQTVANPVISNVTLETLSVEPMSQDVHADDGNYKRGFKLNGSYEPTVMPAYAYYMSDNQFKQKSNGNTTNTKGIRAWIEGATEASPAKINALSVFDDQGEVVTAIDVEQIAEALGVKVERQAAIYTLSGQKVSADGNRDQLPRGMYIQNGKKFVVK